MSSRDIPNLNGPHPVNAWRSCATAGAAVMAIAVNMIDALMLVVVQIPKTVPFVRMANSTRDRIARQYAPLTVRSGKEVSQLLP